MLGFLCRKFWSNIMKSSQDSIFSVFIIPRHVSTWFRTDALLFTGRRHSSASYVRVQYIQSDFCIFIPCVFPKYLLSNLRYIGESRREYYPQKMYHYKWKGLGLGQEATRKTSPCTVRLKLRSTVECVHSEWFYYPPARNVKTDK